MSFPGEPCGGSPRPLLCSQGRFIIRGAGWGGVQACVDAQLRKCRGHRARSGRAGAAGQGCGSERGVPGLSLSCGALASSTCPRRSPSSRLGRLAAAMGWGAPGIGPPLGGGQRGPGETQGKQAQGAVAAGERAQGTLGHTVSVQGTLPRAWSVSSRGSGRDRAGSGGQGSGRASEQDSGPGAGTHGGSSWLLVGPVGAEGTAGLK